MIVEAPTELMRYGTMAQWLRKNGLTQGEVDRLVKKGVIQPCPLRPGGRKWYNASQIKEVVFNRWETGK